MTRKLTPPAPVSLEEFDATLRAGEELGPLGAGRRARHAQLPDPRQGRRRREAGEKRPPGLDGDPDRQDGGGRTIPTRPSHFMSLLHDIPISESGLTFGMCYLGMGSHGDAITHVDALNHVGYKGKLYNGKPVSTLTSRGSEWGSITAYATGLVGRGVLLDAARHRGVDWLEPGEAVTAQELEEIEKAQGVRLGEGDILVFRTGHHARRLKLGAWSNEYPPAGEGKAGLHVDTVPWMHERRIAAFLPDGDGETVPSNVEGMPYPIHPLQLTAMGM